MIAGTVFTHETVARPGMYLEVGGLAMFLEFGLDLPNLINRRTLVLVPEVAHNGAPYLEGAVEGGRSATQDTRQFPP